MKQIARIKRKLIKRIFALFSFTTALFIFQACYGMPQDLEYTVMIEGTVKSKSSKLPLPGIQVFSDYEGLLTNTDQDGKFTAYASINLENETINPVTFEFKDIDNTANGEFMDLDTTFVPEYGVEPVIFNVFLSEEK